ncbi:hypothetical protein [Macrococcus lamae]|uniref:Uncharacterized protein n=1 Tax=Macrococcus lamae TaxID=198484 RepID=A0A4V3BF69_9STAP|nr:hypothetical protein [Macrococcus lamae]TDM12841.1 hypothetical protein ERX29_02235 [Macrococcus lamae]
MKAPIRIILLILGIITLLNEIFLGIPILGGTYIVSLGWAPLGSNILMYIIMAVILAADRYSPAKDLMYIPILGIILNMVAFIPFVGMVCHWIMTLFMILFVIRVMATPTHVGNTRVYYGGDTDKTVNRRR